MLITPLPRRRIVSGRFTQLLAVASSALFSGLLEKVMRNAFPGCGTKLYHVLSMQTHWDNFFGMMYKCCSAWKYIAAACFPVPCLLWEWVRFLFKWVQMQPNIILSTCLTVIRQPSNGGKLLDFRPQNMLLILSALLSASLKKSYEKCRPRLSNQLISCVLSCRHSGARSQMGSMLLLASKSVPTALLGVIRLTSERAGGSKTGFHSWSYQ